MKFLTHILAPLSLLLVVQAVWHSDAAADPRLPELARADGRHGLTRAAPAAVTAVGQALDLARWVALDERCDILQVVRCTQSLQRLQLVRGRGLNFRVERAWQIELGRLEAQADALPWLPDPVVQLFDEADPRSINTHRIERRQRRQALERQLEEGRYDEVISEAAQYAYRFSEDDWCIELTRQARYRRAVERWQDGHPGSSAVILDLWYTVVDVAGEPGMDELPTPGQLVEVFFHGDFVHTVADVENFVRRVQQYADRLREKSGGLASVNADRVAGRAEYLGADFLWRQHLPMSGDGYGERAEQLLLSARQRGYLRDPLALRLRMFVARNLLAGVSVLLLALASLLSFVRSVKGRRWAIRWTLRQAVRARRTGHPLESATLLVTAALGLERLHTTGHADVDLLAAVYRQLMLDSLERNKPAEGAQWGEKILDLPAEHWPPNFASLGRRCGLVIPAP